MTNDLVALPRASGGASVPLQQRMSAAATAGTAAASNREKESKRLLEDFVAAVKKAKPSSVQDILTLLKDFPNSEGGRAFALLRQQGQALAQLAATARTERWPNQAMVEQAWRLFTTQQLVLAGPIMDYFRPNDSDEEERMEANSW